MKGESVRRLTFMFLHAALCLSLFLLQSAFSQEKAPPKLVVGIVIDQFRYDYLAKNKNLFSEKGFNFLQKNGVSYINAHFNYVPLYTAPGHASIYTGTPPAEHGIVANEWYERALKKTVYCVDDESVTPVGTESNAGKKSPHRLIGNTFGDELIDLTNGKAKVISVSMKDRSAILPAGKAGKAFWFDEDKGVFITSSYYMSALPEWLKKFDAQKPAEKYLNAVWQLSHPETDYALSDEDNADGEGTLYGETSRAFPHKILAGDTLAKPMPRFINVKASPFMNELTFSLAEAAIEGEKLGADDVPDLLAISLGANDYVGHIFGPDSREAQDMALRTDVYIADFLDYLQKKIGLPHVVIFITADHGAAPTIQHSQRMGYGVHTMKVKDMRDKVNAALKEKFGGENLIAEFVNQWFYLNNEEILAKNLKKSDVVAEIRRVLLQQTEVQYVFTAEQLASYDARSPLISLVQMGFLEARSGDVYFELKPFYFFGYKDSTTGADHGSMYNYDSHVPVILFGQSIPKAGFIARRVSPLDIVPTLSAILNMPLPSAATGNVLEEIVK